MKYRFTLSGILLAQCWWMVALGAPYFTTLRPKACSQGWTSIDYEWNVSRHGNGTWELPRAHETNRYQNNIVNHRRIVANGFADRMRIHVHYMHTVERADNLAFARARQYDATPIWSTAKYLFGGPLSGWQEIYDYGGQDTEAPFISRPVYGQWRTNPSEGGEGFAIDKIAVCRRDDHKYTSHTAVLLVPAERMTGVLLHGGSDAKDTIYFAANTGSANPRDANDKCKLRVHDTFALWGTPKANLDLYARCGTRPTMGQWRYASRSPNSQEFIHVTPGDCPCGSTWYLAVVAQGGPGQFNLVHAKHFEKEHRKEFHAGIGCQVQTATKDKLAHETELGWRAFFGATEGAIMLPDFMTLRDQRSDPRSVKEYTRGKEHLRYTCDDRKRATSPRCDGGRITAPYRTFGGVVLAHELGHYYACLPDEARSNRDGIIDRIACGHTMMGSAYTTEHNLCWCAYGGQYRSGLCHYGDHNLDSVPANTPHVTSKAGWTYLEPRAPIHVVETQDNYDYRDHDFNDYGRVAIIEP